MGNYFSCEEKRIVRRMCVCNFEAVKLGQHIVDL